MTKTKEKPVSKEKLHDLIASRLFVYSLIKRIFIGEPNEELIKLLIEENIFENFPFSNKNKQIRQGAESIGFYLKDPGALSKENLEELIVDITTLMLVPGKNFLQPWESVYRSKKKLVFQDETIEVRNEYARQGLQLKNFQREPDDHVALEMDFMAYLCDWQLKTLRKNELANVRKHLKAQKSFLEEHIMKWIPELVDKLSRDAETDFYKGFGKLVTGYLVVEKDNIEFLTKQISLRIKKEKEKEKAAK